MGTLRKRIIRLLEEEECDARIISQRLGISEKEAYAHIPHIMKTITALGKKVMIIPALCRSCGYQFDQRKKISRPGRCPACKKERIDPPRFYIK